MRIGAPASSHPLAGLAHLPLATGPSLPEVGGLMYLSASHQSGCCCCCCCCRDRAWGRLIAVSELHACAAGPQTGF